MNNNMLLGLTSFEKELFNQPNLSTRAWALLTRSSSSIFPTTISNSKKHPVYFNFTNPPQFSCQPSRYFARGALDNHQRWQIPFDFYLLMETNEQPIARSLPHNRQLLKSLCRGKGTLCQNSQGYVYLDVDNQFILGLLPYLIAQGLSRPPYFNLFSSPMGAHIPVIPAREMTFKDVGPIKELGREYIFEIEGLYSVQPNGWLEVDQIWYFKVVCKDLEGLRKNYFLPSRPGGHSSFVLATAIKPATTAARSKPTFRISPAASAA